MRSSITRPLIVLLSVLLKGFKRVASVLQTEATLLKPFEPSTLLLTAWITTRLENVSYFCSGT